MRTYTVVVLAFLLASHAYAQDAPSGVTAGEARVTLGGALQMRGSVGMARTADQTLKRLGFGVRRARFKADVRVGPGAGLFFQVDGAGGSLAVLDFLASYRLSPSVRLRAGRFVSAQPRGLILTGLAQIDVADRANILERWGQATVGSDGRDFGVDLQYRKGPIEALLFLHNGDGNWARGRGNYRETTSAGTTTGGIERTGMAVTGAVTLRPASIEGLELGGFAGLNTSQNPNTARGGLGRKYITWGAHAYFGPNPGSRAFRFKADLMGITFDAAPGEDTQQTVGVSLFGAVRPARGAELFVRGEAIEIDLNGDDDADGFFTAGASLSPSARRGGAYHRERLTLAWTRFTSGVRGAEPQDLIVLQLQLVF